MQKNGKLSYQQLTIAEEKEIGRGSYGKVCYAFCDELPCAAKLLSPKIFHFGGVDGVSLQRFNQECKMLCSIGHPSLVQYLDAYVNPETGQAVLLMELMDESLTSFTERTTNSLPMHIQINLCYDVVQALSYLHSMGIVHRNLTGENILVCAGSRARVTDFGMMKMVSLQQMSGPHVKHMTVFDSLVYMPPEAFRYPPSYTNQIDIFSFGVVSLQIITQQYPQPSSKKVSEIERRKLDISLVGPEHPILPLSLSCLKDTDILRPPAAQLCRKLRQLKESALYEESKLKREEAVQEIDRMRRELDEVQKENDELVAQLDRVRLENKQLSRLISKYSENKHSNAPNREPVYRSNFMCLQISQVFFFTQLSQMECPRNTLKLMTLHRWMTTLRMKWTCRLQTLHCN